MSVLARAGSWVRADDRGSVSVTAAFACAALLALAIGVFAVAGAYLSAQRAQIAADLAALSAAQALRLGVDPCGEADRIAVVNGSEVVGCTVDGQDVVVRAENRSGLSVPGMRPATATARAGPAHAHE